MKPAIATVLLLAASVSGQAPSSRGCPEGWTLFSNPGNGEGHPSCLALSTEPAGPTTASRNEVCQAMLPSAHALTISSRGGYSTAGTNLLSVAVNSMKAAGVFAAAIGCDQDPSVPVGLYNTGLGWAWSDDTPSGNLLCSNPSAGQCEGGSIWGSFSASGIRVREPTDGSYSSKWYDETHSKDVCVLQSGGAGIRPGLFANAVAAAAELPVLCELDDSDKDGVFDHEDACPNSIEWRDQTLWNGCSRADLDDDSDGVCNVEIDVDVPFCRGVDNCPGTRNRAQTVTVEGAEIGDACNLDGCHESCAYGCDPVAMGKRVARNSPAACTAPRRNSRWIDEERCNPPYTGSQAYGCTLTAPKSIKYKKGFGVRMVPVPMTADTTVSGADTFTASASSHFPVNDMYAFNAFDKDTTKPWSNTWFNYKLPDNEYLPQSDPVEGSHDYKTIATNGVTYPGEWIQIEIPTGKSLNRYKLTASSYFQGAPKAFQVFGSFDGVTWDLIDSREKQDNWTAGMTKLYKLYPAPAAYTHYRLVIRKVMAFDYPELGEWDLMLP